jgi:hypothetical protein
VRGQAFPFRWFIKCWLVLMLVACEPTSTSTPAPTLTLIPVTATTVLTIAPPTPTPQPVAQPDQLLPSPTPAALVPILETGVTLEDTFIQQMLTDLAQSLGIDAALVRFAHAENAVWLTDEIGCASNLTLELPVTGYRITLLVGETTYEYHTDGTQAFQRCEKTGIASGELLIAVDPVASEMVNLAQRQLAQQLDLPALRIRLVDISPYTWTDTSLGCPLEDTSYTTVALDGYRVVMAVGDSEYAFHTDSEGLYPCPAGRETLPTAEATPEATAETTTEP